MSMSTGDVRRPSVDKISTKAVAADGDKPEKAGTKASTGAKTATKSTSRPGAGKGASGGHGGAKGGGTKGRRPVTPIKVNQSRNWGPILMFGGAGLVALLIVGFGAFMVIKEANKGTWQEQAAAVPGIKNYLESNPDWFKVDPNTGNHKPGVLEYPTNPPVGGTHNPAWQNCMGDVYTAPIPKEQATHSLEHGAVWIAYKPDLAQDQIDKLKDKVEGRSFMLMAPYPGLDKPISLQAWGYQLKVDNADDPAIDEFISALRQNATQEPQAGCSGGITEPSDKPLDLNGSGMEGRTS